MKTFLLGFVADGAGVVEDQAGVFFGLDLPVALLLQCANHLFGVMGIHLAAEGLKIEGFFGRHSNSEYSAFLLHKSWTPDRSVFMAWNGNKHVQFWTPRTGIAQQLFCDSQPSGRRINNLRSIVIWASACCAEAMPRLRTAQCPREVHRDGD